MGRSQLRRCITRKSVLRDERCRVSAFRGFASAATMTKKGKGEKRKKKNKTLRDSLPDRFSVHLRSSFPSSPPACAMKISSLIALDSRVSKGGREILIASMLTYQRPMGFEKDVPNSGRYFSIYSRTNSNYTCTSKQ